MRKKRGSEGGNILNYLINILFLTMLFLICFGVCCRWRVALVIFTLAMASVVIAEASSDGFVDPSDEVPETNPQQLEQSWEEETSAHNSELLDAEPSTPKVSFHR